MAGGFTTYRHIRASKIALCQLIANCSRNRNQVANHDKCNVPERHLQNFFVAKAIILAGFKKFWIYPFWPTHCEQKRRMTSNKHYYTYTRHGSMSNINFVINSNSNRSTHSPNNIMPIQRPSLRSVKRPWTPSKQQQTPRASPNLPRPEMIKRSTSLPTKLENAPRTKKLFWFRPTIYLPEKENRLDSPVIVQSFPRVESRDMPLLPTLEDDSETTNNPLEDLEELVGLGFLNE